jgi:hypothetical protein
MITGRLQLLMVAIENDIREYGKAIDTYRKQRVMGSSMSYHCAVLLAKEPVQ